MTTEPPRPVATGVQRVRVFVDYWNFQLALNEREAKDAKLPMADVRFRVQWGELGPWLARKAASVVGLGQGHTPSMA